MLPDKKCFEFWEIRSRSAPSAIEVWKGLVWATLAGIPYEYYMALRYIERNVAFVLRRDAPPQGSSDSVEEKDQQSFWEAVRSVEWVHWGLFISGYIAWICDALDFFAVSLSVPSLSKEYEKQTRDIVAINIFLTLIIMLSLDVDYKHNPDSPSELIFGALSDAYGRRYPLTINLLMISLFSLTTAFSRNFSAFLASRALFGVAMGGVWGIASASSLEILPVRLRGIGSGIMNAGYPLGYLIAGILNLALVPKVKIGFRALFYFAASASLAAAIFRLMLPESPIFVEARKKESRIRQMTALEKLVLFAKKTRIMMMRHWKLFIYCTLVMAGLQFIGHGSQDLMLTYLQVSKGLSTRQGTIVILLANVGSIVGGFIGGSVSQYVGRKMTMCTSMILTGAMVPLYILSSSFGALGAGAFLLQGSAWGAWGVIAIHLSELSPPEFRALFPGLVYQVGNMITSASAQIEATGAAKSKTILHGKVVPDYAKVQGILVGVATAFTFILLLLGPENHGRRFETAGVALQDAEMSADTEASDGSMEDVKA